MAYVNFMQSTLRFKVVYYGPALSGKTTNLEYVHSLAKDKVELVSLDTEGDRTIFFDYMPLKLGKLGGMETLFKLYTVPGHVKYNSTRQMVLRDADGIVFVADSQRFALPDNLESLKNLRENLAKEGVNWQTIPTMIQYNKRDLPNVMSLDGLQKELNPVGFPFIEASATQGLNIKETLSAICNMVYRKTADQYKHGFQARTTAPSNPPETAQEISSPQELAPPGGDFSERVTAKPAVKRAQRVAQTNRPPAVTPAAQEITFSAKSAAVREHSQSRKVDRIRSSVPATEPDLSSLEPDSPLDEFSKNLDMPSLEPQPRTPIERPGSSPPVAKTKLGAMRPQQSRGTPVPGVVPKDLMIVLKEIEGEIVRSRAGLEQLITQLHGELAEAKIEIKKLRRVIESMEDKVEREVRGKVDDFLADYLKGMDAADPSAGSQPGGYSDGSVSQQSQTVPPKRPMRGPNPFREK
jgi:hypothetical protein